MNWRLVSVVEKQQNQCGRNRRRASVKAHRRRENVLGEIAQLGEAAGISLAEMISPQENLELLVAHLHRAKAIAMRLKRAMRKARVPHRAGPICTAEVLPRPTRVLREKNRGRVFPALVDQPLPLSDAIAATRAWVKNGLSPHPALAFFVRSADLRWDVAARVLHDHGFIPARFSSADITTIRRAREFWDRYADGRESYLAAVAAGEVGRASGDWGLFESEEIDLLLSGMSLPRNLRRMVYLTNLVRDRARRCLDLYAYPSVLPLVRHPL